MMCIIYYFWQLIFLLISVIIPLICMEYDHNVVNFMGDCSVVSIKKSNVVLMNRLYNHYLKNKEEADRGCMVPRLSYISGQALNVVHNALTVRPDKFKNYYDKLSQNERTLLIKTSGEYNDEGKQVMLDVPEITKRLINVYFDDNNLCDHIKSYWKDEEEEDIRSYFKEKFILGMGLSPTKKPVAGFIECFLQDDIYPGSLFINNSHAIDQYNYSIPVRIANKEQWLS
ncbi:MAG TPA: hypothetical protein VLB80_02610 [Candidatus Babeliales bacterium]|nr:hypothetical protein [Candidatus Babeliales bacterium]